MDRNLRQLRIRNTFVLVIFVLAFVGICGLSAALIFRSFQSERREPTTVFPGAEVTTLVELPGDRAYPEALTIGRDGNIYSGSFCTGDIWRITPEGELEVWVAEGINSASSMIFGADSYLYIIEHGDCDPRSALSGLKRIAPDGTVSEFAPVEDDQILTGLAFDSNGVLYATDAQSANILVFEEGSAGEVWWQLPDTPRSANPTAIAFDPLNNAMLVADSGNGIIYRIPITPERTPGEATKVYQDNTVELDGLTLDEQGQIIFALYNSDQVGRINTSGMFEVLAENFRKPSDVAYADGKVYVTNSDAISLAPVMSVLLDPSLPFTIDVIDLPEAPSQ